MLSVKWKKRVREKDSVELDKSRQVGVFKGENDKCS